jgi:hypothetical protein
MVSPNNHVVMNHQNQTRTNGLWGHVRYSYMQWMNQSGTPKITHKARVHFFVGNYVDTVDCDVAPMSVCHLLLGGRHMACMTLFRDWAKIFWASGVSSKAVQPRKGTTHDGFPPSARRPSPLQRSRLCTTACLFDSLISMHPSLSEWAAGLGTSDLSLSSYIGHCCRCSASSRNATSQPMWSAPALLAAPVFCFWSERCQPSTAHRSSVLSAAHLQCAHGHGHKDPPQLAAAVYKTEASPGGYRVNPISTPRGCG